jgi:hypothetical protein
MERCFIPWTEDEVIRSVALLFKHSFLAPADGHLRPISAGLSGWTLVAGFEDFCTSPVANRPVNLDILSKEPVNMNKSNTVLNQGFALFFILL